MLLREEIIPVKSQALTYKIYFRLNIPENTMKEVMLASEIFRDKLAPIF